MCQAHTPPAKKAWCRSSLAFLCRRCVRRVVLLHVVPSYPPHTPTPASRVLTAAYLVSLPSSRGFRSGRQGRPHALHDPQRRTGALNLWTVVYIVRSLAAGHPLVGDTQVRKAKIGPFFHPFFFCRGALGKTTAYTPAQRCAPSPPPPPPTHTPHSPPCAATQCSPLLRQAPEFLTLPRSSASVRLVSFLHPRHHTTIALAWWAGVKPTEGTRTGALLNRE